MKKLPQSIVFVARIYRQKRTGNLFHTVQIIVDGNSVHKTAIAYGGWSDYWETGCSYLEKQKIIPTRKGEYINPFSHLDKAGIISIGVPIKVCCKKDL